MILFFNILTVCLLALVAGLLLVVGQQVRVWRKAMQDSPLLAEKLAEQLLSARRALDELKKGVLSQGPELNRLLSDGGKLRTELQFLLQRADKAGAALEGVSAKVEAVLPAMGAPVVTPPVAPVRPKAAAKAAYAGLVEQVAGANGHAVQSSGVSKDPLEALLEGLQGGADALERKAAHMAASGTKRRGPVTQAELELQEKLGI
jgi:hypothetical protein